MKHQSLVQMLGVLCIVGATSARADFTLTFDSGPLSSEWSGASTWSAGPVGWAGAPGTLRSTVAAGGWQWGPVINFDWASGHQPDMQVIAASGNGRVSFDYLVDGTSFNTAAQWYQLNVAGNSANGWTQLGGVVDSWQNAEQSDLRVVHVELTFAQLGWTPTADWFQLNFGANSEAANPINYHIDNLAITTVPEPSTLALAGLAGLGLLIARRRK